MLSREHALQCGVVCCGVFLLATASVVLCCLLSVLLA